MYKRHTLTSQLRFTAGFGFLWCLCIFDKYSRLVHSHFVLEAERKTSRCNTDIGVQLKKKKKHASSFFYLSIFIAGNRGVLHRLFSLLFKNVNKSIFSRFNLFVATQDLWGDILISVEKSLIDLISQHFPMKFPQYLGVLVTRGCCTMPFPFFDQVSRSGSLNTTKILLTFANLQKRLAIWTPN